MSDRAARAAAVVRGFYAVLDRGDEELAHALVGDGGARVLQVRIKPSDAATLADVARMARRVCDAHGAALVVNDRVDVALAVGADGVHLGQTDLPIAVARELAGDRVWIGISTHDIEQVARAVAAGADYLGFGPVFATTTKRDPDPVQGIDGLAAAVRVAADVPVVAIGGIGLASSSAIYGTGAAALCAISAVNNARDVAAAARALGRPSA